jgi:hypothetical protein
VFGGEGGRTIDAIYAKVIGKECVPVVRVGKASEPVTLLSSADQALADRAPEPIAGKPPINILIATKDFLGAANARL